MERLNDCECYYYGCWGKEVGHYLHDTHGNYSLNNQPWFPDVCKDGMLDGGFEPYNGPYGAALLHHLKKSGQDWTIIAFKDNSVDTRPGSHSTFIMKGQLTFEKACEMAAKNYPEVWGRYKFKVKPTDGLCRMAEVKARGY